MYASADDRRGDAVTHAATTTNGEDRPLLVSGSTPRGVLVGKIDPQMRKPSLTRLAVSPLWGVALLLSAVIAAALGAASITAHRVSLSRSTPYSGSAACGETDLWCWRLEAEKLKAALGTLDEVPAVIEDEIPAVIFHAHIAKTAGSTLNRFAARRYHATCGRKGMSFEQPFEYDFSQNGVFQEIHGTSDGIRLMQEWGLHNCGLISIEQPHFSWAEITNSEAFEAQKTAVMIPCRDPIDHILSQCNFRNLSFTSIIEGKGGAEACANAMPQCQVAWVRYDHSMLATFDKVVLFKYDDFPGVERYLDDALPKRRLPLREGEHGEFGFIRTNRERDPEHERFTESCTEDMLRNALLKHWSYYRLCDTFLGDSTWQEYDSGLLRQMIQEQRV